MCVLVVLSLLLFVSEGSLFHLVQLLSDTDLCEGFEDYGDYGDCDVCCIDPSSHFLNILEFYIRTISRLI